MKIDKTPLQVAANELGDMPFDFVIGKPLTGCIEAQQRAAKEAREFVPEEDLELDPKPRGKKSVNASSATRSAKAQQDNESVSTKKMLEGLNNRLDVCDPSGVLEVNSFEFKGAPSEQFLLIATYKNRDGLFEPAKIQIPGLTGKVDGDSMVFQLPVVEGKTTSYIVGVLGEDKKLAIKTIGVFSDQKNHELSRIEREKDNNKRLAGIQASINKRREELDAAHAAELKASQERVHEQDKKEAEEREANQK